MLRPIFVIGNSTHGLSRGMGFVKALSLHNLRIKTKNVISDIDPNRSHWNLIWSPLEQNWQQSSANKANLQYQYLLNHIQTTLVPFREQVKNHNHYLKTHHRSAQIQTWRQHCARKQIAGEWILSASQQWFIQNQCIKAIKNKGFIIINHDRILIWATAVMQWAQEQFSCLYSSKYFLQSVLHLDESNIHIHFQYLNCVYRFNKTKNRAVYSFTTPHLLDRAYLKTMQASLLNHVNKKVVSKHNWKYYLDDKVSQKNHLDLYRLKLAKLKEQCYWTQENAKYAKTFAELKLNREIINFLKNHNPSLCIKWQHHLDQLPNRNFLAKKPENSIIKSHFPVEFLKKNV